MHCGGWGRSGTCRKFRQVRIEGSRKVTHRIPQYNLDLIISVDYRVKSKTAIQFRIWAAKQLSEHLVHRCAVNEKRLEQLGSIIKILGRSTDELASTVADAQGIIVTLSDYTGTVWLPNNATHT